MQHEGSHVAIDRQLTHGIALEFSCISQRAIIRVGVRDSLAFGAHADLYFCFGNLEFDVYRRRTGTAHGHFHIGGFESGIGDRYGVFSGRQIRHAEFSLAVGCGGSRFVSCLIAHGDGGADDYRAGLILNDTVYDAVTLRAGADAQRQECRNYE